MLFERIFLFVTKLFLSTLRGVLYWILTLFRLAWLLSLEPTSVSERGLEVAIYLMLRFFMNAPGVTFVLKPLVLLEIHELRRQAVSVVPTLGLER